MDELESRLARRAAYETRRRRSARLGVLLMLGCALALAAAIVVAVNAPSPPPLDTPYDPFRPWADASELPYGADLQNMRADPAAEAAGRQARVAARAEFQRAIEAVLADLEAAPLDSGTRTATRAILNGVRDDEDNDDWSGLDANVTRRLIRHGWLRQLGLPSEFTQAAEDACWEAAQPRPAQVMVGLLRSSVRYEDAWGRTVDVLRTPETVRLVVPQPDAQWLGAVPARKAVLELEPGSDPLARTLDPKRMEIRVGSRVVCLWERGSALRYSSAAWDHLVCEDLRGNDSYPPNLFPMHALATNVWGDPLFLATAHGVVRPAQDGSPAELQRFFDEAARALPDVAHMDLVGELLYDYAWDTAEYDRPLLIGTEEHSGDIHQTAAQTLQTCCGGTYRGDCDDLACLYHALTLHQGRNAHVLSLPHHLANAYAERTADGSWIVAVLHTGPPLALRAPTLEAAIKRTYEWFDSHETIDLEALPVSLRFGGDAVRETYILPYTIFGDRDYARGLVAVQGAYRFHTYQAGVETMEVLLRGRSETSAADHRELAHLLTWAQRDEDATAHFRRAHAAAQHAAARVETALDLLGNLVATKSLDEARTLAERLEDVLIPALEAESGGQVVTPWVRVASALLGERALCGLGLACLAGPAKERVTQHMSALIRVIAEEDFEPRALHYSGYPRVVGSVDAWAAAALAALAATGPDAGPLDPSEAPDRAALEAAVATWLERVAIPSAPSAARALDLHAAIATLQESRMGRSEFARVVEAAGPPQPTDLHRLTHPRRVAGEPFPATLRWIHVCQEYRRGAWVHLLAPPKSELGLPVDRSALRRALYAELTALDAAGQRDIEDRFAVGAQLLVRLVLAFLEAEPEEIRPVLAEIAARNDHEVRDMVAGLIGATARLHDVPDWTARLALWAEALDHGPHQFEVVWGAMSVERPEHALAAARQAVAHRPNEPDFKRELEILEARIHPR
ncbi:MAG: hypothetical protein O2894_11500 [Planctomycetota bacterium]|nr:hypothetical protein [Planctomycetota bacterium]